MSSSVRSCLVRSVVLLVVVAAGCGGSNTAKDAGGDATDALSEAVGDTAMPDAGGEAGDAPVTPDASPADSLDAADASDTTDAVGDAPDDGPRDAPPDAMDGPSEEGPPPPPPMLTVDALLHSIVLDRCTGFTPATIDVPAGQHTIALTASTLSKGSVSDPNDNPIDSYDDYVIVNLPLSASEPASRRFFMLNGIGNMKSFMQSTVPGTVKLMFIDSDATFNAGQATVKLDTTGPTATVDATANIIAWNMACSATPASLTVSDRPHRATLTESTLSAGGGGGSADDFVLLRLPTERPMDPHRFVILNGVGATIDFTPYLGQSLRAWFITTAPGATGRATIVVTDL
jgi:hypothetical protein